MSLPPRKLPLEIMVEICGNNEARTVSQDLRNFVDKAVKKIKISSNPSQNPLLIPNPMRFQHLQELEIRCHHAPSGIHLLHASLERLTMVFEDKGSPLDLSPLTRLTRLELSAPRIGPTQLQNIPSGLRCMALDNFVLPTIIPLSLKELSMFYTLFSWSDIKGCSGLQSVHLKSVKSSLGSNLLSLEALEGLTGLKDLWLDNIKTRSLVEFSALCELRSLTLRNCRIRDESLKGVTRLTNLRHLDISGQTIVSMESLPGLEYLNISWPIQDLSPILTMTALKTLKITMPSGNISSGCQQIMQRNLQLEQLMCNSRDMSIDYPRLNACEIVWQDSWARDHDTNFALSIKKLI